MSDLPYYYTKLLKAKNNVKNKHSGQNIMLTLETLPVQKQKQLNTVVPNELNVKYKNKYFNTNKVQ